MVDRLLPPRHSSTSAAASQPSPPNHDLVSVIACALDHRTRMLPFIYADTRMAPAGVRAHRLRALVDVGFPKTRIVLQQWNKNFDPSQMRLDGRIPDIFPSSPPWACTPAAHSR